MCAAVFGRRFPFGGWDSSRFQPPWDAGPSVYEHIKGRLDPAGGLLAEGEDLPDEPRFERRSGIRFSPGARDGIFGHHAHPPEQSKGVARRLQLLKGVVTRPGASRLRTFYESLLEDAVIEYIDPLIEAILEDGSVPVDRAKDLARWIATGAPDREPVKFAIALLGVCGGEGDRDLLVTLGLHDEFTLYATLALIHVLPDAEETLWELAQKVHGWGRVHLIERLSKTEHAGIQGWMLRGGYKNAVMDSYTALPCALTGRLADALAADEIDAPLFAGAGGIIHTLIDGRSGPGRDIDAYEDAPLALARYLDHAIRRDLGLEDLITIGSIRGFLAEGRAADDRWSSSRAGLLAACDRVIADPAWKEKVTGELAQGAGIAFGLAAQAAPLVGVDPWPAYFERLQRGEDYWYESMLTNDPARVDLVIQHAMQTLDLGSIATGPADELGLGPQWSEHGKLDWVLQELRRFPGKGWRLIEAGLRSPVIRNRNMALAAIAAWDRASWTDEVRSALGRAAEVEPLDDVRARMEAVQRGEPLEW